MEDNREVLIIGNSADLKSVLQKSWDGELDFDHHVIKVEGGQDRESRPESMLEFVKKYYPEIQVSDHQIKMAETRIQVRDQGAKGSGMAYASAAPLEFARKYMKSEFGGAKPTRLRPPEKKGFPGAGRNQMCPCGSDKKYKRCCINKLNAEIGVGQ